MKKKFLHLALYSILFTQYSFSQSKIIDSLRSALSQKNTKEEKVPVWIKLSGEYNAYQIDSALKFALLAVETSGKNRSSAIYAASLSALADAYYFKLNKPKRDSCMNLSTLWFLKLNDKYGACNNRLKKAGYLKFDADLKEALTEFISVNKEAAKHNYATIEAWSDTYLSEVYTALGKYTEALKHAKLGLAEMQKLKMNRGIGEASSNVGLIYDIMGRSDSALFYYNISLEAVTEENLMSQIANTRSNIGVVYFYMGDYKNAIKNYEYALELNKKLDYPESKANNLLNLGEAYTALKQYATAEKYMLEGMAILDETHNLNYQKEACRMIAALYDSTRKYDKAYRYHLRFSAISDSLYSINSTNAVAEMQVKFDTEKKQKEIEVQNAKLDSQNSQLKEEQFQRLALYLGLGLVLVLGAFIYNRLTVTRKQKLEVEIQKKEVEKQKYIIEEHQKEIVDSINYAKRIQYALLAHEELLNTNLPGYFVLFKPKDIVSGDFYWATPTRSKGNTDLFYLAACDSTGHGVPGAFMSLLNIGFLNEAIKEKDIYEPNEILNYVRQRLITSIGQDKQTDGMDAILVKFETKEFLSENGPKKIEYAAANNEPILIRDNKIIELPKDKMPVGKGELTDSFTLHTVELQKGDLLYLYTDGFADQFGGPKGKKFKYKQLNELLLSINKESPAKQSETLHKHFEEWKGNLEQVDDVCIIGIKI